MKVAWAARWSTRSRWPVRSLRLANQQLGDGSIIEHSGDARDGTILPLHIAPGRPGLSALSFWQFVRLSPLVGSMSSRLLVALFFVGIGCLLLIAQQSIAYPRIVARNNKGPQLLQTGFRVAKSPSPC